MEKVPTFVYVVCDEGKPTLRYYLSTLREPASKRNRAVSPAILLKTLLEAIPLCRKQESRRMRLSEV